MLTWLSLYISSFWGEKIFIVHMYILSFTSLHIPWSKPWISTHILPLEQYIHGSKQGVTDNWSVAWKPLFTAHLYYLSHRGLRPPRPLPRRRPHLGYLDLRASRDTGPSSSWTQLSEPTIIVVNVEVRVLAGTR